MTKSHIINVLLISNHAERSSRLPSCLQQHRFDCNLTVMKPGRRSLAIARRSKRYRDVADHDLVMIDFVGPDPVMSSVVQQLAARDSRLTAPLILLTMQDSESELDKTLDPMIRERSFAPTSLSSFVGKLRQHSIRRFLRALTVVSEIGPIIVRLPGYIGRPGDNVATLSGSHRVA